MVYYAWMPWMKLAHDLTWLWAESLTVMTLRTSDLLTGQGSARENAKMVSEKAKAGAHVAGLVSADMVQSLMTGRAFTPEHSAAKAVRHYRKVVEANRKRLTKPLSKSGPKNGPKRPRACS